MQHSTYGQAHFQNFMHRIIEILIFSYIDVEEILIKHVLNKLNDLFRSIF
jgi:hypothetical protein